MKMKQIQELADTTTGTTGIASVTPEIWSAQVERAAQELRVARNFVKVNTDLLNGPGDIVHLPKSGTLTAIQLTEGVAIVTSAMDGYNTLDLTPYEVGAGTSVTKDVVENLKPDILADSSQQLSDALAQKEDLDILIALETGTTVLYGGSATSTATLALLDLITTDLFADAVTEVRKAKYHPDVLFIAPEQENVFIKDSQFVDASKYGASEIVQNGELGKYLGVRVISTVNTPAHTNWGAGSDVLGHSCLMIDSKHAGALAVKRTATIETKYEPGTRMHEMFATLKYQAGVLNNGAICVVKVTDM